MHYLFDSDQKPQRRPALNAASIIDERPAHATEPNRNCRTICKAYFMKLTAECKRPVIAVNWIQCFTCKGDGLNTVDLAVYATQNRFVMRTAKRHNRNSLLF